MSSKEAQEFARVRWDRLEIFREELAWNEINCSEQANTVGREYAETLLSAWTAKLIKHGSFLNWERKFVDSSEVKQMRRRRNKIEDAIFKDQQGDPTALASMLRAEAQDLEEDTSREEMQWTANNLRIIADYISP